MRVLFAMGVVVAMLVLAFLHVFFLLVAVFLMALGLAENAHEGDLGGIAVDVPVVNDLQVMVVQLQDFAAQGVGDEHRARGCDHVWTGPEAGLYRLGQEIIRRRQQV